MTHTARIAAFVAILIMAPLGAAQDVAGVGTLSPPPASPWDDAFASFAAADTASPPPDGGVVFVGSSSIRLWKDLEHTFQAQPVVIKRGFGGSKLSDCVQNLRRLVTRYRPRTVLVYAGDNDLASGSTPEQVLRRFTAFVEGVHRDLPRTRIDYISIKPSPARRALMPLVRETNALIAAYVAGKPGLGYIDVFTPMLDELGEPRRELFLPDRLHLNRDGYALWKSVIAPYVVEASAR
ncbi:MAG TPA: SGNH/GDSL hydrolase family protein [Casimicrobiaceae bacterium]|jgi:lysophospholipase L1-like esterase